MARIVAIGGGEIGRPGCAVDTLAIDAEVVRLAGKRRPHVVFLPTATKDDSGYVSIVNEHYGRRLGCVVEPLFLFDRTQQVSVERIIRGADIVYVGGGNTLRMMNLWRRRGVDQLLMRAASEGTVLAGISAGAICWCTAGVSDSRAYTSTDDTWSFIAVRGLGLVDVLLCPHYDSGAGRREALRRLVDRTRRTGLGVDDCAALEIIDDRWRIVSSREGSGAHRVDRGGGARSLASSDAFRPIAELV